VLPKQPPAKSGGFWVTDWKYGGSISASASR
jgi:hypothetical protein